MGAAFLEMRRLGTAGIEVSRLGLAIQTLDRSAGPEAVIRLVHRYVDAGGRLVEAACTAGGTVEEAVGRALRGSIRHEVTIAMKVDVRSGLEPTDGGASRRRLIAAADASLRCLRTDRIDLYQLHGWDPTAAPEGTLSVLDELVRSGRVLYLGVSDFAAWQLARAQGMALARRSERFQSLRFEYSLTCRGAERELIPVCLGLQTSALAWVRPDESLWAASAARRATARDLEIAREVRRVAAEVGRSPAQVVLNWVLHAPGLTAALVSLRNEVQLAESIEAFGWRLPAALRERLDECSQIELGHPHEVGP
jgi:aryl-alcohol dehydrogenase-like predicted oxidoreductase